MVYEFELDATDVTCGENLGLTQEPLDDELHANPVTGAIVEHWTDLIIKKKVHQVEELGYQENPVTGAMVDFRDIDSVIQSADDCTSTLKDLKNFDRMVRQQAVSFTDDRKKTRRIRGKKWQAKVENCDSKHEDDRNDCSKRCVYPNGSLLMEAWNSYPQFREEFLKIGEIKIKNLECAKLAGTTSDDPAFTQFQKMILEAVETGSPMTPKVVAERLDE